MVGYATLYTFAPVFSLVLDRDVNEVHSTLYPELYAELTSGRSLSYRTFFVWLFVSVYQGAIIQGLSQLLLPNSLVENFRDMVALSYIGLILNELSMVAIEITTWHPLMIVASLFTLSLFIISLPFLDGYMNTGFLITVGFMWRLAVILAVSLGPIYAAKVITRWVRPPTYRKVMHV
jgi:phospholipid-translocating ATPase